jgi:hypothetical protein
MTVDGGLPRPLRAVVTVALCVVLGYALVAMPMAMLGVLRPVPALLLTVVVTAGLLWLARGVAGAGVPTAPVARLGGARAAAIGVGVLAAAWIALNAHFASEHVLSDRDPGIYVWLGRWLADHGSVLVEKHSHLFAGTGGFEEQCPVTCNAGPGRGFYVQFLHLLPATFAAGAWLGGSALMLKVNAIAGGISLLAFYAFATRIVRPLVALGAALALAVNFVQVYFARDAYSEILAQLFLFGGLFVLWDARATWDSRRAVLAGLLLGATCMARIDSFVYLIPLGGYVLGELALAEVRERRRFALAVGGGVALTAALGAVDLLAFSRGYYHIESSELHAVWLGIALTLALGVAAVVLARRRPQIRALALRLAPRGATAAALGVAALGLFAYLVRPHLGHVTGAHNGALGVVQSHQGVPLEPTRTYGEQTVVWLGWYLGPVALLAGLAGLALAVREVMLGRRPALAPFAGVALVISALYVARPSIFPTQVWAMRRFLPVTIPALLVLGAWAAQELGARLGARRPPLRSLVPALVIAAAVLVPAWQLGGLIDTREQAGGLRALGKVCDALPKRAVVWTTAGSGEARLLQPVHVFCGVPVAQSLPGVAPSRVRELARRLKGRGRPLYLMSTKRPRLYPLVRDPGRVGRPIVFRPRKLEESVDHRPKSDRQLRIAFYLARP